MYSISKVDLFLLLRRAAQLPYSKYSDTLHKIINRSINIDRQHGFYSRTVSLAELEYKAILKIANRTNYKVRFNSGGVLTLSKF